MFTGIVEEMGRVLTAANHQERDNMITIGCRTVLPGTRLGDSIALNGACLTVTDLADTSFTVGLSPETLRRTNLGQLRQGDLVNLERSVAVGARMGGHYVQGHIDGVGEIVDVQPDGESHYVRICVPTQLMPYIVEKGFIAVDGVSLTVTGVTATTFTIALIAYSQTAVIMGHQDVGTLVNLEVDIIAKYVERLAQSYQKT